jgi:hypothetical protein
MTPGARLGIEILIEASQAIGGGLNARRRKSFTSVPQPE